MTAFRCAFLALATVGVPSDKIFDYIEVHFVDLDIIEDLDCIESTRVAQVYKKDH